MLVTLYFTFPTGYEPFEVPPADLRGVPIPVVGDYYTHPKGEKVFLIKSRRFLYDVQENVLNIFFECGGEPKRHTST